MKINVRTCDEIPKGLQSCFVFPPSPQKNHSLICTHLALFKSSSSLSPFMSADKRQKVFFQKEKALVMCSKDGHALD